MERTIETIERQCWHVFFPQQTCGLDHLEQAQMRGCRKSRFKQHFALILSANMLIFQNDPDGSAKALILSPNARATSSSYVGSLLWWKLPLSRSCKKEKDNNFTSVQKEQLFKISWRTEFLKTDFTSFSPLVQGGVILQASGAQGFIWRQTHD